MTSLYIKKGREEGWFGRKLMNSVGKLLNLKYPRNQQRRPRRRRMDEDEAARFKKGVKGDQCCQTPWESSLGRRTFKLSVFFPIYFQLVQSNVTIKKDDLRRPKNPMACHRVLTCSHTGDLRTMLPEGSKTEA